MKKRSALAAPLPEKPPGKPTAARSPGRKNTRRKPAGHPARSAAAEPARPAGIAFGPQSDPRVLLARIQMLEFELAQKHAVAAQGLESFSAAADKLQDSFKRTREQVYALQREVDEKNRALDDKNQELERNLFEKEKVKNYLASIFESLPVGVLVTDLEGGVTSVNRAGQAMIGAEASALLGQNVNQLMGAHLAPRSEAVFEMSDPLLFVRKDGEPLKFQVSVTRMHGEGDRTAGYVVNLQDVTLLKKLEEHAERRNRFTVMGEMAANMAHEIRNPLGSIELFASLVRKGLPDGDEKRALLNHIFSAVASMNHIISNVLEYSKPRAVSLQPADLHGLLEELAGFFRFMANQNGVELVLAFDAPHSRIRGDRELLKQAFHNLLLNAVQAMPEGGTLTIGTRSVTMTSPQQIGRFGAAARLPNGATAQALEAIEATVKDTGAGMPPEVQARIFDPFYTTKSRGTGLGLAIVHTIVEAHHATIDVQSAQGRGTSLVVAFPAIAAEPE
jgi:PAS domain S-box-containing protein